MGGFEFVSNIYILISTEIIVNKDKKELCQAVLTQILGLYNQVIDTGFVSKKLH